MTDDTIDTLLSFKSLATLYLDLTDVTPAGIKRLSALETLEHLGLPSAAGDACLDELAKLPRLKSVFLGGIAGGPSKEAIERFRKAKPECEISSL